jgi:hypothetical protein
MPLAAALNSAVFPGLILIFAMKLAGQVVEERDCLVSVARDGAVADLRCTAFDLLQ